MLGRIIERGRSAIRPAPQHQLQPQPIEPEGIRVDLIVAAEMYGRLPVRHTIYTAHRVTGELWGRCLCGATLKNEGELTAHRQEFGL